MDLIQIKIALKLDENSIKFGPKMGSMAWAVLFLMFGQSKHFKFNAGIISFDGPALKPNNTNHTHDNLNSQVRYE